MVEELEGGMSVHVGRHMNDGWRSEWVNGWVDEWIGM